MNEEELSALDKVINCIKESSYYQEVISLKQQINNNKEIKDLIAKTKKLEKEYVKTNDLKVKKEFLKTTDKLFSIPLYNSYMNNLEEVNLLIDTTKEYLNDYFQDALNLL